MAKGDILVFSEKMDLLAELTGGAVELAGKTGGTVTAVIFGPRAEAEHIRDAQTGAARVIWVAPPGEDALVEDVVPTLVSIVEQSGAALLLVGATRQGRAVAGRVAAHFDVSALTDVQELDMQAEGEVVTARHLIFGGGAVRVERTQGSPVIATAGPGVFSPSTAEGGAPEIVETTFIAPVVTAKLRERRQRPVVSTNLGGARRVVCVGRGLQKQEDLSMVEELARALGAELACTRPLAEGLDWLPRERYIGISGATVRPDLYLGVGVSGQAQHLIGMGDSKVVVAVNKDASAPICSQADYVINEDLYTFVPALIAALKNR